MAKVVMRQAELPPQDGDIHLSPRQYMKLSLFSQLKRPPSLDRFPGAMVVRRYRKGDKPLFLQGEAGWTAFYILTLDDVLAMQTMRLENATRQNEKIALQLEVNRLREEQARRQGLPDDDVLRRAATVHMATLASGYTARGGMRRLLGFSSRPGGAIRSRDQQTLFVPVGGPNTISYETGKAPLFEGDLFGEMSCLFRTPRSATVVADRDCYMIEFLRHILEAVHRDPVYKARADSIYLKRVFELQIRKMPLFADLNKEEFEEVRKGVELVSFEPGDIICDEHERSDCLYLVRQGLVKVMKNVSHLVNLREDITEWGKFAQTLRQGEQLPGTPVGKFWSLLPEPARNLLRAPEPEKLAPEARAAVIGCINDVLKDPGWIDAPEIKPITDSESFEKLLPPLPAKRQEWSDSLVRHHNRLVLEALCPTGLRQHRKHAGVETILSYCSTNDYIGEIGLVMGQPRSATCIAFGHPNHEGTIELVKIPRETFDKLLKMSPALRERVKEVITERRHKTLVELTKPVWEESGQVQGSEQFSTLGLIQGQRLMLIDLDRCTRCDECVKACVSSHSDGRTRLFLDGPRFGKYLVPTACRSCLDPVCMIPCPVSSIRRGDDKEIVIEDWCIGCGACAESCPYGSIQMHDLGLIPAMSRGWRWLPGSAKKAQGDWMKPGFKDADWIPGETPFVWARELQDQLRDMNGMNQPLRFRCTVSLDKKLFQGEPRFKVELLSLGSQVRVWVNGEELTLDDRVKRGRHEYSIPPIPKEKPVKAAPGTLPPEYKSASDYLRPGNNVIAVEVAPSCKQGETLMQLRLDPQGRPAELPAEVAQSVAESGNEEVIEKLVTHVAVVCDLCASLPSKRPACVHACPHDAAMRVDARTSFPTR